MMKKYFELNFLSTYVMPMWSKSGRLLLMTYIRRLLSDSARENLLCKLPSAIFNLVIFEECWAKCFGDLLLVAILVELLSL